MSGLPIVEEINKVVYNLLASEQAVHIPTVGSLLVVRQPARQLSGRRVAPPFYDVVFTSKQVGRSLPEAIACMSGGDATGAAEIYDRWLARTLKGDTLVIEGIGVLRQKSFAVDAAFAWVINPHDRTPLAVRSAGSHWFVWTIAILAVVCGIGACGWILYNRASENILPPMEQVIEVVTPVVTPPVVPVDSLQLRTADSIGATKPATPSGVTGAPVSLQVADMTLGRSYVVLGVFSTEANARRAAEEAMKADASLRCGVWTFGRKFLVSLYVSDDDAACIEFVNSHIDQYPDAWSYKSK